MKIVFLADSFPPYISGVTTHTVALARKLCEDGHKLLIIAPSYDEKISIPMGLESAKILYVPSFRVFYSNLRLCLPNTLVVYGEIKKFKPDIIDSQVPSFLSLDGLLAARRIGVAFTSTFHTLFPTPTYLQMALKTRYASLLSPSAWALYSTFYNACSKVFVATPKIKQLLVDQGVESQKIVQIPILIELPGIYPLSLERKTQVKAKYGLKRHTAVFIGRISGEKSLDVLLKAWSYVVEAMREVTLLIIGVGPWDDQFDDLVERYRLQGSVVRLGLMQREYFIKDILPACDIFVSASTSETLGLATLEAMGARLPVVLFESQGISELVGEAGIVCKVRGTRKFADSIVNLFKSPILRSQMGEKAHALAQYFTAAHGYKKIVSEYEDTILVEQKKKVKHGHNR